LLSSDGLKSRDQTYTQWDSQRFNDSFCLYAPQSLTEGYHGMAKVDQMVLPFPYAQLLKIFSYCIVFMLPWVLAPRIKGW